MTKKTSFKNKPNKKGKTQRRITITILNFGVRQGDDHPNILPGKQVEFNN